MVAVDEIRALAQTLPRSCEVLVRGKIKFRVGQIVWLALSKDGEQMGCDAPSRSKQRREAAPSRRGGAGAAEECASEMPTE